MFIKVVAALIVAAPVSVFGTFMLGPLWAWFESAHGVESVGHAMYAGWCFVATYALVASAGLALVFGLSKRRADPV